MGIFNRKKADRLPVELPVPNLLEAWACGKFDNCDYFALTAPIDKWSTAYPMHCLSEAAGKICNDGWGIVTWKLTVFVYSSKSMVTQRAKTLGRDVKPLIIDCLSCFARAFSNWYTFVDIVLDESWHIETYLCRDMATMMPGVSHLRLSSPDGLLQLQGCEANDNLEWIQYPAYDNPNHPAEWCRPVSFPSGMVMYDHSPQSGSMDIEIVSEPETLELYIVNGVELAQDVSGTRDVIFTRPTGPVAFSYLGDEPVRLTKGEGVWIPVAISTDGGWRIPQWGKPYKVHVHKILNGEASAVNLCRGCQWHTNKAMAILEQSFLGNDDTDLDIRDKTVQLAIEQLEKAVKAKSSDWYVKTLLRDLKAASDDEIPAIIHADRCAWLAGIHAMDNLEEEYEAAMVAKPNYHLGMYNRAMAKRFTGDNEAWVEGLENLLKCHPQHAQALFDLGVFACMAGDEEREMHLYAKSIEADPTYSHPYYNIGKTYEDNGDVQLAKKFYKKALEQDPHYIEATEQLAGIMWVEGSRQEAVKLLEDNVQSNPLRVDTYQKLLQLAQNLGDTQLMLKTMGKFQENLPRIAAQMQEGS